MPSADLRSYLQLHLIVFIWGFTAVLGELITIRAVQLVWFRMLLAGIFLLLYLLARRKKIVLPKREVIKLIGVGCMIAVHWIFFFHAIDVSNVSVTLAMFSVGAFFASVLEPIFYKRSMLWYELFFGLIVVAGLLAIMRVETKFIEGICSALFSVFMGVMFTIFNGKLTFRHDPAVISMYEFLAGCAFVSIYIAATGNFSSSFFTLSMHDWILVSVLASVCTAYAFTSSVNVMRRLSPYTVMLTTNLEPVYGIFLAYFIIGDSERMSLPFYIVSAIILLTVIANGMVKHVLARRRVRE